MSRDDERFVRLQKMLELPLPGGLPRFVHDEGLERLHALQKNIDAAKVDEFRKWVFRVRRCFFFFQREGI
jgi:hypothetical protein